MNKMLPDSLIGLNVSHIEDGATGRIVEDLGGGPDAKKRRFLVEWDKSGRRRSMQASLLRCKGKSLPKLIELETEVLGLLRQGRFGEADRIFEKQCTAWWGLSDYRKRRDAVVRELHEAEKKGLKDQVLGCLKKGLVEDADRIFKERCAEWWGIADYEQNRDRAVAINDVVTNYPNCSLRQLTKLLANECIGLSPVEIAALKLPKLDTRLERLCLSLDEQQRLACARPEQNLLIRARAGSGKTRTLAAIAALAIEDGDLSPDQVLILAFNKKAAEEIGERVRLASGVAEYRNARTFHSLAWQLADHAGRQLVFDDGNLAPSRRKQSRFVERVIHAVLNPAFREKLYEFFRRELDQIERIGSNLEGEEYLTFRRAMTDFSLGGESVKSNGEKFIADFLFEHGISYEYEKVWSWSKQERLQGDAYRPDFSMLVDGKDLIWEHWGIDPDNPNAEVPRWWKIDTREYRDQIEAKRRFWKKRGITLIETHADMLRDGREAFEGRLKVILGGHGFACRKLDHAALVKRVSEAPRTISRMAELFLGFISRAKKRGWSVEKVAEVIAEHPDVEPRNRVFHELAVRAYAEYENLLAKEKAWDFDDMLIAATEQVQEWGGDAEIRLGREESVKLRELRWLLIDEFQDFSGLYYQLILAIIASNSEIRVVAVGDDWQAINGFAGAQLSFFNEFDRYFKEAGTANIATNYRSDLAIVGAGNKVMADGGQAARARPDSGRGVVSTCDSRKVWVDAGDEVGRLCLSAAQGERGSSNLDLTKSLKACVDFVVDSVYEQDGRRWLPGVLVLARTGYAYGLKLAEFKVRLLSVLDRHPSLLGVANTIELDVMTAHRSKGREADTVIVLEVTARKFPKVHADNQLFAPFGVRMEDTLAEERRLFYVAVTRAEHRLLLLSETGDESPFLTGLGVSNGGGHLVEEVSCKDFPPVPLGEIARSIKERLG